MIANFIDVSPAMRYMRSLSAEAARRAVGRQKGECTWCGQQVPRPRIYWCSDDCRQAFFIRCDPAWARDHFINTQTVATKIRWCEWSKRLRGWYPMVECQGCHSLTVAPEAELDHIVPVSEGGGLCGPDNYRLLCLDCHKQASAEGAARRAKRRRQLKGDVRG